MSAAELVDVDTQDSRCITRAVAEITPGEGRTLDVRIVPYNLVAEVSDPGRPLYREEWMQGAFADQVRGAEAGRAREVYVNYRHGSRLADVLGHGLTLRESNDGFYGSFQIHETPDGDKALYMVEQKVLAGVSLEAYPKKSVKTRDGVVQRVKAHLVNIALCPNPAYEGAGVLAIREEDMVDEDDLAPQIDMALVERCVRLGIKVPERFTKLIESSEPDENDNSGSTG